MQKKYHSYEKKTTGDEAVAPKQKHIRKTRAQRKKKNEEKRKVCKICILKRRIMTLTVTRYNNIKICTYTQSLHLILWSLGPRVS